ncbi:UvrD-helicase domain-containing protein [Frankia tisae]|uniref:UvrD-helicase domain-containing protein n=1 Tax=Frankia tisae TaxID=2950104 RepID=UPI0021C01554|nr:UvrD-helicase domain-containing protein [Frankia tisae]
MASPPSGLTFSPAQLALIEKPGSRVVKACPGAGKTQSIVERFIQRPGLDDRRGVALISFTNAAITAAEARCRDRPTFLKAPNFVGTIDSFINRYIVGPIHTATLGKPPSFRDTWDTVPGTLYSASAERRLRLHLSWFSFALDGTATLASHKIPGDRKKQVLALTAPVMQGVTAEASYKWRSLTRAGFVDCEYARHLMSAYFAEPEVADPLRQRFFHRFGEVIIDEFQDSNGGDAALIRFLQEAGISVVMVGDVDQEIYGFRQATTGEAGSLAGLVEVGEPLDGNYRSTPAICKLVDSLRHGNNTDAACGQWAHEIRPVHVLKSVRPAEAAAKIAAVAAREGFGPEQIVVLAHGGKDARSYAGAGTPVGTASSRIERLAQAVATIRDGQVKPHARAQAIALFESILRELGRDGLPDLPDDDFFKLCGLTQRQFRAGCLRLVWRVAPYEAGQREFQEAIKTGVAALGWEKLLPRIGVKLKVTDEEWKHAPVTDNPAALPWSTVHGYKGLQSPAVAVVIPELGKRGILQEGVSFWENGQPGETRRVLYVAASRAQRLAILVVDESQHEAVIKILNRDNVPFIEA